MADGQFSGFGMNPGMNMGMNSMLMTDPAMASALARQSYANALMQQGSDISPIRSPYQAFARALQGVLGGYMGHQAMQSMQDIGQQYQQGEQDFIQRTMAGPGMAVWATRPLAPRPRRTCRAARQPRARAAVARPAMWTRSKATRA
jgi:hypothetical protein